MTNQDDKGSTVTLSVPAGTVVFAQGEPGNAAYLLHSGSISMRQAAYGQMVELDIITPGEVFGEMAVLGGGTRLAAAVAVEDCVISRIPAADFARHLDDIDPFLRGLVAKVIKDIRSSYRAFLRRPRSLRDHLRQMRAFGDNMRRFAAKIEDAPVAPELLASLDRIDVELERLLRLADATPDKRHDIILDEGEEYGLAMKSVLGSEARRSVTARPITEVAKIQS
ncbi:MAG: cyclic nucleotide-binding domain-containing protein [Magnetospirillum sp.]|nr:cyclic nucleotide-binding domain-containing protein [Magnetospirillum sp.]